MIYGQPLMACLEFAPQLYYTTAGELATTTQFNNLQVDFWQSLSEMFVLQGLFWDFWEPYRLICDPKTGRKLLLGQKISTIKFRTSQEALCLKKEFHGLVFWGWNTVWLKIHFFSLYWILNTIDFKTCYVMLCYISFEKYHSPHRNNEITLIRW